MENMDTVLVAFESAMMHLQKANKRLHRLMNSTSDGRTKEEIRRMIDNM